MRDVKVQKLRTMPPPLLQNLNTFNPDKMNPNVDENIMPPPLNFQNLNGDEEMAAA